MRDLAALAQALRPGRLRLVADSDGAQVRRHAVLAKRGELDQEVEPLGDPLSGSREHVFAKLGGAADGSRSSCKPACRPRQRRTRTMPERPTGSV